MPGYNVDNSLGIKNIFNTIDMKNKWLNDAEIPDKYIVTNEELLEERAESYNKKFRNI